MDPPPDYTHPIVQTLTTPELCSILNRSNFSSLSQLLQPFSLSNSQGTSPIELRSPNYDTRTVHSFPLHFTPIPLPNNFDSTQPKPLTPNPNPQSVIQSDEIFLDLLTSSITSKIDSHYLSSPNSPPLLSLSPKLPLKQLYTLEGQPIPSPPQSEPLPPGDLTPWYTEFRKKVFERRDLNPFESFAWPICCVLALSTSHSDPLNALSYLWDLTSPSSPTSQQGGQEYVNPEVLRYILLVHDVQGEGSWEESKKLEDLVKKTYGVHVGLIPLFSGGSELARKEVDKLWPVVRKEEEGRGREEGIVGLGYELPPTTTTTSHERKNSIVEDESEQKGQELSLDDLERLKGFVRELVVQSIVPWIERTVTVLNEQFTSNKKSIGGRLFSVGRSYFGRSTTTPIPTPTPSTRPGSPSVPGGFNSQKGYYDAKSPESQSRRLADLLFVLRDYKLAFKVYEELVKDFKGQQGASKYWESALRMQGLCLILSHLTQSNPLPSQSPDSYLLLTLPSSPPTNIPPSLSLLRSAMHYHQLYSHLPPSSSSSTTQIMSRLSDLVGEEGDEFWSALFMEQSAHTQITTRGGGNHHLRKGARELLNAGKKFEKCGMKSLSRRCLDQASKIYEPTSTSTSSSSFKSIRSHLHHSLGVQAYNLGKPLEAIREFLKLLETTTTEEDGGEEEGQGQVDWLEDFELAWDLYVQQGGEFEGLGGQELPKGLFEKKGVRVSERIVSGREVDGERWGELEDKMSMSMRGKGKGKVNDGISNGQALVGETFHLELPVRNPLENFLSIGGLTVKHRRKRTEGSEEDERESDLEVDQTVEGEIIELAPLESRIIYVPIRGSSTGTFQFISLSYRFHNLLPITESLSVPIPRRTTLAQLNLDPEPVPTVLPSVTLRPPIPVLTVSSEGVEGKLFHGQSLTKRVRVRNDGQVGMRGLRVISSNPEITFFRPDASSVESKGEGARVRIGNEIRDNSSVNLVEELRPGEEKEIQVIVRGNQVGLVEVKWLFAYESTNESNEVFSTRTTQTFEVQPSLEFRYSTRPSIRDDFPFMLNLEAYNSGIPSSDLRITSVSLLSPIWKLSSLPGLAFEDLASPPIAWQQFSNLAFAISPVEDIRTRKGTTEWSVKQVEGLLQGKKIEGSKPGEIDLECSHLPTTTEIDLSLDSPLLSSLVASHSHHRSESLSSQFPAIPLSLLRSIFPLFSSTSALILVHFSSPSLDLSGTHFLPITSLGASSNVLREVLTAAELKAGGLYEESQRERTTLIKGLRASELGGDEDPASVSVEVEGIKEHAFDQGPCSLPVTFAIRNLSTTNSFDYLLQLGTTSDSALIYTGLLTRRGTIAPLSLARITAKAFILREGIYDVGGWTLNVSGTEGARNWVQNGEKREIRVRGKERERKMESGMEMVRLTVPVVA